jgi:hypothetical protein
MQLIRVHLCYIAFVLPLIPAQVFAAPNLTPEIGAVHVEPLRPKSGQAITISINVRIAVTSVQLQWQPVLPGEYIRRTDPEYEKNFATVDMRPIGGGPGRPVIPQPAILGIGYQAQIPGKEIKHRWLYRYRVLIKHADGKETILPDPKDVCPNYALFCYDGVPAWSGSREPGKAPLQKFSAAFLNTIKPYHLIARGEDVATSQWDGGAHKKRFAGTFVYDGVVYDHIAFTNRGQGSAYISGKNKWALKFNKEHPVPLTDNQGRRYQKPWNGVDLNPGTHTPYIPVQRGIAGLDEATTFRAYQLAGVPSSSTHWVHFRVIDGANETSDKDQSDGDLWGLYLAIADLDQEILDEQKLPDGLIVSMQSGIKHTPADMSAGQKEWDQFIGTARSNPPEKWWRENLNLPAYYSFHTLNRLMGNVDIRPDGNHGYYRGPDGKWSPLPWDNDMCFVPRHHQPGYIDAIQCLNHAAIKREYQNRAREILDLFAADASPSGGQVGQLVADLSRTLTPKGFETNWAQLDDAMWNWHPRFNQKGTFFLNPAYGDHFGGRWERRLATNDIQGFEKYLVDFCTDSRKEKNYQPNDGNPQGYGWGYVAHEAIDKEIPPRPVIERDAKNKAVRRYLVTKQEFPADRKPTIEWRVARITAPGVAGWKDQDRYRYELEEHYRTPPAEWNTDDLKILANALFQEKGTYRIRARYHDPTGRASHWSEPVTEIIR